MKLLAVFGLALAVVAVDKSTSSDQNLLTCESQLKLFEADPDNPVYCSKILSMVNDRKISLAENPKIIFPLVTYCLGADDRYTFPEDHLKMSAVHVAAFIFMLRVKGGKDNESMVEYLYSSFMEEHFLEKFKARLHEQPYTMHDLENFEKLTEKDDKEFSMLRTVQKYGKELESKGLRQFEWFLRSKLAALVLVNMGIPPELLIVGIILYPKSAPERITPGELLNSWLMFFSLTKGWYLKLEEPEKAQLLAFLEKCLQFHWRDHSLLKEKLSGEELRQFKKVFVPEDQCMWKDLELCMINRFAWYFCNATQIGCPAFLLKRMLDFYLEESSKEGKVLDVYSKNPPFSNQKILDKRLCFLRALERALYVVGKWKRPDIEPICSQIKRTIKECESEISEFCEKNPGTMEEWKEASSASGHWAAFKMEPKDAYAELLKLFD